VHSADGLRLLDSRLPGKRARIAGRIMRIESITLRELRMPLKAPFQTSFGVIKDRRVLLVETHSDGLVGWGEVTALEGPWFSPETTDTAKHVIVNFIAPLLSGAEIPNASTVPALLLGIRGHGMAKAGVENSLWDIESQRQGISLARLLGGTKQEIECGVSLGIQSSPERLLAKIDEELAAGYRRIKIKIKPGQDLDYVAAARSAHPTILLSVDANSAYSLDDIAHLKKFDQYQLLMIEQPLWWDDILGHAKLQSLLKTSICLDESIHNVRQAENAIELHACRILNIKLGRVGGHTEARKMQQLAGLNGIPVWCGGMLESGIGRAHNIAMSTLPAFTLPGDVSASSRYWTEDIIEPEVEVTSRGTIKITSQTGLGFHPRTELIDKLTVWKQEVRSSAQVPLTH